MSTPDTEHHHQGRLEGLLAGLGFALLAAAMVYLGSRGWLPPLASRHGAGIDRMLIYLLSTTGVLFLVGHLVLGYFIWRYTGQERVSRRTATPRVERRWSVILGLLMTLVAEGGVLAIGLPAWKEYFGSAPPADALTLEVTGEQFAWTVRYPGPDGVFGATRPELINSSNRLGLDPEDPFGTDDHVAINQIRVPVGQPVRVRLRAKDVIHSFFLPALRVKQDAVPGMSIEIWFVPDRAGTYELACTELCGLGHYQMRGLFHVLEGPAFESWLAQTRPAGGGDV